MRDFNRSDRGGRRYGGGGGGGNRQMHHATCANCNRDCEVPFRPTGEKPVYCSDCFSDRGGNDNRRSPNRSGGSRPAQNFQNEFDALNKKLDDILEAVLSNGNPVNEVEFEAELEEEVETETKPKKKVKADPVVEKEVKADKELEVDLLPADE